MQASSLRRRSGIHRDESEPQAAGARTSRPSPSAPRSVRVSEDGLEYVVALLLLVLVVAVLARPVVSIVTVHDYQRGQRFRQGRLVGLLDPGTHIAIRPLTRTIPRSGACRRPSLRAGIQPASARNSAGPRHSQPRSSAAAATHDTARP